MKCTALLAVIFCLAASSARAETNPLLEEWKAPFGAPPFDRIRNEHYAPALREAMRLQREAIARIVADPAAPSVVGLPRNQGSVKLPKPPQNGGTEALEPQQCAPVVFHEHHWGEDNAGDCADSRADGK